MDSDEEQEQMFAELHEEETAAAAQDEEHLLILACLSGFKQDGRTGFEFEYAKPQKHWSTFLSRLLLGSVFLLPVVLTAPSPMASSPENKPMGSPPPFPSARRPQENPQPTDPDPPEPAQSDHTKPTPPPHPGNATATAASPEAYESPAPVPKPEPKDGTARQEARPSSLSAPPALEATEPVGPTSPLPPPKFEACPEAATTGASPSPSPQILAPSAAAGTPPPSTPSSPPGALSDAAPADSAAMVSKDAAWLPAALESMDSNRPTAPTPPKPPLKSGQEGFLPQQHPRPPCPTVLPGCENSEPAQPPSPRRPAPANIAHASPDTAEADAMAVTSAEPCASSACKSEAEESFELPMPIPLSSPTEAGPWSPEMAPQAFEKFESSWPPLPSPNLSVKTTHSFPNASMPEEASNSLTVLEAMDARINTAPGLPRPSFGSLQQPLLRPLSPITQAELCSPDMPPPGSESLSRLPPPNETTYTSFHLISTKAETVKTEEAVLSVPALEAIHVETDGARNLLPPLESKGEGLLKQPLLRSTTPVTQSETCSPKMAPPRFESLRSSWQPLSTPLCGTTHIMQEAAAAEPLAVKLEEEAGPRPALEEMDVDMHAVHPLLAPLESGMEGSLQEEHPRPPSPTVQDVPCSPDMAPPGFENFKSPQLLLPSPLLAQTAYTCNDPATSEAEQVSEDAAQPSPAPEAMDVKMEISLESGAEGSLPQQLHELPTLKEKSTACSLEMVTSGHENLQLLPLPPLLPEIRTPKVLADMAATESVIEALDQVHHLVPLLGAIEEGTSLILSPPLESGSEGLLPHLEPQAMDTNMDRSTTELLLSGNGAEGTSPQRQHQQSSPSMQAAPCSLGDLELLPPPPPPFISKEMGQMVCGSCRELIAYPRGAVHVQCAGCRTINLVLEAHEVGNVRCGRCEILLMYPLGAPAVKCSLCFFVTEIGERNVRPRISVQQAASPHPPELVNQG
ncbi:flocculation protein FLO11-like [Lolium rigidum]|uniref:flocculation protein FLO11-like n=1 Tax=Lolium rigidum TaxID=89674 RepID=UPI001F5C63BB|nr:flocculation protein FLO11-like [Lolium rigidum]